MGHGHVMVTAINECAKSCGSSSEAGEKTATKNEDHLDEDHPFWREPTPTAIRAQLALKRYTKRSIEY